MKRIIAVVSTSSVFLPFIALAQFGSIDTFLGKISTFINGVLIPLVFAAALLVFIYGMFQYFVRGGASDDSQAKGKSLMIYAVLGFVLMVSIWGIVNLVAGGLGTALGTNSNTVNGIPSGPSVRPGG